MGRSKLEVGDIFRAHGGAYRREQTGHLNMPQLKVMSAIENCRTAALGGHVAACTKCDHQHIAYNSCRNRHCPKCQSAAAQDWMQARMEDLLPVQYFHVVFTLPPQIADIAYQNKEAVYGLLFKASAQTLQTIAADPKHLGAKIGMTSVLHTWGSAMTHHPHVHVVVPGGGLSSDGQRWVACRKMLDRVKDTFDLHPERIIADTAYGSGPMLGWLVDRKIAPHIPVIDKAGRTDGTWSRADFEWDPENDQYVCLEGQSLKQFRRNYSDPNRGPDGKGVAKYRALKLTCQACPSKAKCCPNADFRSITREEHEDARQVARDIAKTKQYVISMRLRKKVEMLFAHLKRILGLGRLRLRGPCGANDEFLLAATAQNLRKLAKIFPAPQQTRKAL